MSEAASLLTSFGVAASAFAEGTIAVASLIDGAGSTWLVGMVTGGACETCQRFGRHGEELRGEAKRTDSEQCRGYAPSDRGGRGSIVIRSERKCGRDRSPGRGNRLF